MKVVGEVIEVVKTRIVRGRLMSVRTKDYLYEFEGYIESEGKKYKVISKTNLKTGKVEYILREDE